MMLPDNVCPGLKLVAVLERFLTQAVYDVNSSELTMEHFTAVQRFHASRRR